MKYRVTIEEVTEPSDEMKYFAYVQVYQQTIQDLDVNDLIVEINRPLAYTRVPPYTPFSTSPIED